MSYVQKVVTEDSFDAAGVLVPAGHIGTFDTERLSGKEKHLKDVGDFQPAVVEIAAIGPSGPNPTMPQQLPADAVQGPDGTYRTPGKILVSEVTNPVEERIDDRNLRVEGAEDAVHEALGDVMDIGTSGAATVDTTANTTTGNADDKLVEGTVGEVTADLDTKTDDQLVAMRAAEADRESPRKGVLGALDAEIEARKAK